MEPFFFQSELPPSFHMHTLDENTSKHCIQVLRMTEEQSIRLTDGKGHWVTATIKSPDKRHCTVFVSQQNHTPPSARPQFSIAVAFTKNNTRNEWLLEKLTEIGTANIYPILTEHSERWSFKQQRYEKVLIAALLQSQQTFLPRLHEVQKLDSLLQNLPKQEDMQYFIAHCHQTAEKKPALAAQLQRHQKCLLLIGPEGDFSREEVAQCLQYGFLPVHLGANRLRTETASVFACSVYNAIQHD